MSRGCRWGAVVVALAGACGGRGGARGSEPVDEARAGGAVSVAIYPGTAIVREQRRVSLTRGTGELTFAQMPRGLDAGSVRLESLTDPVGTRAVAQIVRPVPAPVRALPDWVEITGDPAHPLRMTASSGVGRHASVSGGVTWTVLSERGGEQEVAVTYQTSGLSWRADYAVVLDEGGTADVNAWITVDNQSGRTFDAAELILVERLRDPRDPAAVVGASPSNLDDGRGLATSYPPQQQYAPPAPQAPRYRRYRYRRHVTLRDRAQRQLQWFATPLRGVAAARLVVFDPVGAALDREEVTPVMERAYGTSSGDAITVGVELPPVERELPPGDVRVFERAGSGALTLLGRAPLERVEAGAPVQIQLGAVAGLRGRRRQTDFRVDARTRRLVEELEIELTNDGDKARDVVVREHLYRGARFAIPSASTPYVADGARAIRFAVSVPGGGTETLRYRVVYSWDRAEAGGPASEATGATEP